MFTSTCTEFGNRHVLWRTYQRALAHLAGAATPLLPRSIEPTDNGWVFGEPCLLSTAEVLKATLLMERLGIPHPFDTRTLMARLVTDHLDKMDYEVIGLALWAAAIGGDRHAPRLWDALVTRLPRGASNSMALAWVLCGVCEYSAQARRSDDVAGLARALSDRLIANQHPRTGLFLSSARRQGWLRRLARTTTLSSQTFPILALGMSHRQWGANEALTAARRCADTLCVGQGSLGQWWWRFDVRNASVIDQYPVYTANQDGAVPAAFGLLHRVVGSDQYVEAIDRGLAWELGNNESGKPLVDEQRGIVARSVEAQDSVRVSWTMRTYQPARCLFGLLSDPEFVRGVTASPVTTHH